MYIGCWPRTLEEWDEMEDIFDDAGSQYTDNETRNGMYAEDWLLEPVAAIHLIMDCGMYEILPSALYALSRVSREHDWLDRRSHIPQTYYPAYCLTARWDLVNEAAFHMLIAGKHSMQEFIVNEWAPGLVDECTRDCPHRCHGVRHCLTSMFSVTSFQDTDLEDTTFADPLRMLRKLDRPDEELRDVYTLCLQCAPMIRLRTIAARQQLWNRLPGFFGVPIPPQHKPIHAQPQVQPNHGQAQLQRAHVSPPPQHQSAHILPPPQPHHALVSPPRHHAPVPPHQPQPAQAPPQPQPIHAPPHPAHASPPSSDDDDDSHGAAEVEQALNVSGPSENGTPSQDAEDVNLPQPQQWQGGAMLQQQPWQDISMQQYLQYGGMQQWQGGMQPQPISMRSGNALMLQPPQMLRGYVQPAAVSPADLMRYGASPFQAEASRYHPNQFLYPTESGTGDPGPSTAAQRMTHNGM